MNRRDFLKLSAVTGVYMTNFGLIRRVFAAPVSANPLDPGSIPKFVEPLVIPPVMPRTPQLNGQEVRDFDYYEIAIRQFQQQILPASLPKTTLWGYGSVNHPTTFNYPSFTLEASYRRPVRVKWINDLKDANGNFLPHLLPVDPTLHWANPPGGETGRDTRPTFTEIPSRYTGPVPLIPHLHGGERTPQESDGYPEAWFLPAANNIPPDYATVGSKYNYFKGISPQGAEWGNGAVVFEYPNDQRASALWYHDHTLGMTRLNVYAGPAGFYIVRGGPDDQVEGTLPQPFPTELDQSGLTYYEIPLAIQDRSFNDDGSLFYPDSREFFDGFTGPYVPESDMSPIWNPEFFGDSMLVNGRTWPFLTVEQRRYRFRILNGCNSRFLILKLSNNLPFWQIGTEGGFLPEPIQLDQILMGPGERTDVIVDFTYAPVGTEIVLQNIGPDSPFGGLPIASEDMANPNTTGQVMMFRVVKSPSTDPSTPPNQLGLPKITPLADASVTRQVSLNELDSEVLSEVGPLAAQLGTVDLSMGMPMGMPMMWMDEITENPAVNATEIWEIYNFTMDAHPMHIHEVMFQVINRQQFMSGHDMLHPLPDPRPLEAWETGFKDTVIAYPSEITRVKMTFYTPGLFVWHCHIVEHEDNEMMRPYAVGPISNI